jgi:SAM-dependent methyltransferase
MSNQTASRIANLVSRLPELYQPIFGHPELSAGARRGSDDRLAALVGPLIALGKPRLRLLDIGCAQGYFALSLAREATARGIIVEVVGIDTLDRNIDLCRELAAESGLPVEFRLAELDRAFVESLEPDSYDGVLLLNVLHHVAARQGFPAARNALLGLMERVDVLACELARAVEPETWSAALPESDDEFLSGIAFCKCLGTFATHVSDVPRRLYLCSNHRMHVDGHWHAFASWRAWSHSVDPSAYRGTRHYFSVDEDRLGKQLRFDGDLAERNREEYRGEVGLLRQRPPTLTDLPQLIACEETPEAGYLVREKLPGHLASELMVTRKLDEPASILRGVLERLADLELAGLAHLDLRPWNVLVSGQEVHLIDYGAVQPGTSEDPAGDVLTLAHQLLTGTLPQIGAGIRPSLRSPVHFPANWRGFVRSVNLLRKPEVRAKKILALLNEAHGRHYRATTAEYVLAQVEVRFNDLVASLNAQVGSLIASRASGEDAARMHAASMNAELFGLRSHVRNMEAAVAAKDAYAEDLRATLAARGAELERALAELGLLRSEVDNLAVHAGNLSKSNDEKARYLQSLEAAIAAKDDDLIRQQAELERVTAEGHRQSEAAQALHAHNASLSRTIDDLRQEVSRLGDQIALGASLYAELQRAVARLETERAELDLQLAQAREAERALERRIAQSELDRSRLEVEARTCREGFSAAHAAAKAAMEEKDRYVTSILEHLDRNRRHASSLATELARSQDELREARQGLAQAVDASAAVQKELGQAKDELARLGESLKGAREEVSGARLEVERTLEERSAALGKIVALEAVAERMRADLMHSQHARAAIGAELDEARRRIAEKESVLDRANLRAEQAEAELRALRDSVLVRLVERWHGWGRSGGG